MASYFASKATQGVKAGLNLAMHHPSLHPKFIAGFNLDNIIRIQIQEKKAQITCSDNNIFIVTEKEEVQEFEAFLQTQKMDKFSSLVSALEKE